MHGSGTRRIVRRATSRVARTTRATANASAPSSARNGQQNMCMVYPKLQRRWCDQCGEESLHSRTGCIHHPQVQVPSPRSVLSLKDAVPRLRKLVPPMRDLEISRALNTTRQRLVVFSRRSRAVRDELTRLLALRATKSAYHTPTCTCGTCKKCKRRELKRLARKRL